MVSTFPRPFQSSRFFPALLAGVAAVGLPLPAQKVRVTPNGNNFQAGSSADHVPGGHDPGAYRARFQFHARLEGELPQPSHWEWSVVDLDGKTVLPDAGTISAEGVYTPSVASLSKFRMVKVRAGDPGDRSRTGTAMVVIRPHGALQPVDIVATHALGPNQLLSTTRPILSTGLSGGNLILTWPLASSGFNVQWATNLLPAAWSNGLPTPQIVGGCWQVSVPISVPQVYYRLAR